VVEVLGVVFGGLGDSEAFGGVVVVVGAGIVTVVEAVTARPMEAREGGMEGATDATPAELSTVGAEVVLASRGALVEEMSSCGAVVVVVVRAAARTCGVGPDGFINQSDARAMTATSAPPTTTTASPSLSNRSKNAFSEGLHSVTPCWSELPVPHG
jgi:hypothetical protein